MDGICKPISHRSPFRCKQISGHFSVQSSSTSSGSRRLNSGSCHTPKFALPYSIHNDAKLRVQSQRPLTPKSRRSIVNWFDLKSQPSPKHSQSFPILVKHLLCEVQPSKIDHDSINRNSEMNKC